MRRILCASQAGQCIFLMPARAGAQAAMVRVLPDCVRFKTAAWTLQGAIPSIAHLYSAPRHTSAAVVCKEHPITTSSLQKGRSIATLAEQSASKPTKRQSISRAYPPIFSGGSVSYNPHLVHPLAASFSCPKAKVHKPRSLELVDYYRTGAPSGRVAGSLFFHKSGFFPSRSSDTALRPTSISVPSFLDSPW